MSVTSRPWSLGRRIVVAALTFGAIGALLFATAGVNDQGRLAGAGSTLVNPVLQRVSTSYQSYRAADRIDPGSQKGESGDWVADAGALDYDRSARSAGWCGWPILPSSSLRPRFR
ncbi:MAG: hypothetical protein HC871_04770 [Rhizobiales bacterium]|nr:hypothetical protein [Hyphomicrobiales bacterium]